MSNHIKSTFSLLNLESPLKIDDVQCLEKKAYEAPTLICYGDVRDITLGGTLGQGESGQGFEFTAVMPF